MHRGLFNNASFHETATNAVAGRTFGVTCAARDSHRVHIWSVTRSRACAWRATYNYWCWSIATWNAVKQTKMQNSSAKPKTEHVALERHRNWIRLACMIRSIWSIPSNTNMDWSKWAQNLVKLMHLDTSIYQNLMKKQKSNQNQCIIHI